MSLADPDLIARVLLDDDHHAFGELVRRHKSAVRGTLRKLTGGNEVLTDELERGDIPAGVSFVEELSRRGQDLHVVVSERVQSVPKRVAASRAADRARRG